MQLARLAVISAIIACNVATGAFGDGLPATYTRYDGDIDLGFGHYRSDADLHAAMEAWLGPYAFSMESCAPNSRTVRITTYASTLPNPFYSSSTPALDETFREAIAYAWTNCPVTHVGDPNTVDSARLVWSTGVEIARATDFTWAQVDPWGQPHNAYRFATVVNSKVEAANADWATFFQHVWIGLQLLVGALVAFIALRVLWLVRRWPRIIVETLVRFYYELTPHPAAQMVRGAIGGRLEIDGDAFSALLQTTPTGRIEREVRQAQAAHLAELMRTNNEKLRKKAEKVRRKIEQQAAYQAGHIDLQRATMEQQLAAKRAEVFSQMEALLRRQRA